jgi:hypothetical protein
MEKSEHLSVRSLAIIAIGAGMVVLFAGAAIIAAVGHGVPEQLWTIGTALSGALIGILIPSPRLRNSPTAQAATVATVTSAAATSAALDKAKEYADRPDAQAAANEAAAQVAAAGDEVSARASKVAMAGGTVDAMVRAAALVHANAAATTAGAAADAPTAARASVLAAAAKAATDAGHALPDPPKGLSVPDLAKIIVPIVVLIVAGGIGIWLQHGGYHPAHCTLTSAGNKPAGLKQTPACEAPLLATAKALIALASAAGGALIGLFGSPQSKDGSAQ